MEHWPRDLRNIQSNGNKDAKVLIGTKYKNKFSKKRFIEIKTIISIISINLVHIGLSIHAKMNAVQFFQCHR